MSMEKGVSQMVKAPAAIATNHQPLCLVKLVQVQSDAMGKEDPGLQFFTFLNIIMWRKIDLRLHFSDF